MEVGPAVLSQAECWQNKETGRRQGTYNRDMDGKKDVLSKKKEIDLEMSEEEEIDNNKTTFQLISKVLYALLTTKIFIEGETN